MKYKTIIWDFNGTILNDARIAFNAVNEVSKMYGYPEITYDYYRDNMDTPIIRLYEKIYDLSKHSFEELDSSWCKLYENQKDKISLQKGVYDVIKSANERDCNQVILSAYMTADIKGHLRRLGIEDYFAEVLGTDCYYPESKTVRGRRYMTERGINPAETVYIGDTVYDYETARGLGAECILMSTGQQSEKVLKRCKAPVFVSFADVKKYLNL